MYIFITKLPIHSKMYLPEVNNWPPEAPACPGRHLMTHLASHIRESKGFHLQHHKQQQVICYT